MYPLQTKHTTVKLQPAIVRLPKLIWEEITCGRFREHDEVKIQN